LTTNLEKQVVLFFWGKSHVENSATLLWWTEFTKSYKDWLSPSFISHWNEVESAQSCSCLLVTVQRSCYAICCSEREWPV